MSFTPETLLRHWQTLRLIPREPQSISSGELCNKLNHEGFSISKRSVERDLQTLSLVFPLVVNDDKRPYGWSWSKTAPVFDIPGLTTNEALALILGQKYLRAIMPSSLQDSLQAHYSLAERRLATLAPHSSLAKWMDKVRVIPAGQPLIVPTIAKAVEATLHEALLTERQCEITYRKKDNSEDTYPINPLAIVLRGELAYMVCAIREYTDIRILVLHRIIRAKLLTTPRLIPPQFNVDRYINSGAFGWGGENTILFEAIFSAEASAHLVETPLSTNQTLTSLANGKVQVKATLPDTAQLRWWLLGFGEGVEVIAPASLRADIADTLRKALIAYQN